ncbi:MAG: recombinase family protein [Geobacteraceae bacterium]|nr:recombinase family protein [Geobacteraceae bacterium]
MRPFTGCWGNPGTKSGDIIQISVCLWAKPCQACMKQRQSPTGNLMQTMLAAVTEFEREMMLERQAEGIRIAKATRETSNSFQE